jgi:carboxypeptidase Taq
VQLISKITKSKKYHEEIAFINNKTPYPLPDQKKLAKIIAVKMGYDFAAGRMDIAPHPFTDTLGSQDVRITNHYNLYDFRGSFGSVMHEAGHGIYEQQIDKKYAGTPLESGVSLGIHESMSRFWENMVGKNPLFLRSITGTLKTSFVKQLVAVPDEDIVLAFNLVKPSLIRIHADEVTYSLHIILRFEMENDLINGKISAKEAPAAWAAKSKALLGREPATDSEGVLQDVHWAYGDFGYFPSYALGNFYGAQFLEAMEKEINLDKELRQGNLTPIKDWLDKHIHTHGSLYFPNELLLKATGKKLDSTPFINYLTKKYKAIYD